MAGFTDPDRRYGDGEANATDEWEEIDLGKHKPLKEEVPFRLVVRRFKSSSTESEAFIHDPLGEILRARGSVPAFEAVTDDWRVATFVTNHHRTLSVRHVYVMTAVSTDDTSVGVTIYKQS